MAHHANLTGVAQLAVGPSPIFPSTRPPRLISRPMFRFRKHWYRKVTKVGYREMD